MSRVGEFSGIDSFHVIETKSSGVIKLFSSAILDTLAQSLKVGIVRAIGYFR